MYIYYIGVGSNLGNREGYIRRAFASLREKGDDIISITSSTLLETKPWGNTDQGAFLNGVFRCESTLEPMAMLHVLQGLEQDANRERIVHWGPRTLDLDIILVVYVDDICSMSVPLVNSVHDHYHLLDIDTPELTVPHPYFWDRNFVLEPLAELWPDFVYGNQSIQNRIEELK